LSSDFFCCLELMSEGIYRRVRTSRRLWRRIHGYYKEACLSVYFAATTVRNFMSWWVTGGLDLINHRCTICIVWPRFLRKFFFLIGVSFRDVKMLLKCHWPLNNIIVSIFFFIFL
jgi:hypothetical protein